MHIVFHPEDAKSLMKSFELDESFRQEINVMLDDYSIGPIKEIDTENGVSNRKDWMTKLNGEESADGAFSATEEDIKTIRNIKAHIDNDAEEDVWIWVAANKRDVSGYYWLVSQLDNYAGRVLVLHLNNLPFINEKGTIFYPENLSQIPAKEFLKAKKLARPVTASEFEIDNDEWHKLGEENKPIRILEGAKKISQHNADFFDDPILKFITVDWQKANKIINQYLSKSPISNSDSFVFWRIKCLIDFETIESQGDVKNRKELEVKKSSA